MARKVKRTPEDDTQAEQLIAFFAEPEPRSQELELPPPGAAFLMPLENGLFGVCRVLRHNGTEQRKRQGASMALVAASSWIGTEPPDINDPRLRKYLVLTHHGYASRSKPEQAILWVSDMVPDTFQFLGTIAPSQEEENMEWWSSSAWAWFPHQQFTQWQWDQEHPPANPAQTESQTTPQ